MDVDDAEEVEEEDEEEEEEEDDDDEDGGNVEAGGRPNCVLTCWRACRLSCRASTSYCN